MQPKVDSMVDAERQDGINRLCVGFSDTRYYTGPMEPAEGTEDGKTGEGEEGMACYLYHTLVIPPWLEADKVYIRSRCRVSGCVDAAGRI